jgi:tripartite-type tricarboxylate transporter receptor subunit TctC
VRIIVGFAPGGPTDRVARELAAKLQEAWSQPVVVENKPGAGGRIAFDLVAKAAADGHTLVVSGIQAATNPSLYPNQGFDTLRDFEPVSQLTSTSLVLAVNPKSPAQTIGEFVAWAKSRGEPLTYATSGVGSSPHFAGALFEQLTQLPTTHIPFSGAAGAQSALLSGHVDFAFVSPLSATSLLQDGKLRALAVTGRQRSAALPNTPTMIESGFHQFEVNSWQAILAPAGTPPTILQTIHREIARAFAHAQVRQRLLAVEAEPVATSPAEFRTFLKAEIEKWALVAKLVRMKAE